MKTILRVRVMIAALMAFLLCFVQTVSAQITNPVFTTVEADVSGGFNLGLKIALSAIVALLVLGFFVKAIRAKK